MKKKETMNKHKMTYYKSKKDRRQEFRKHSDYRKYVKELTRFIVTTRFNAKTWEENKHYRKNNESIGCIYGSPTEVGISSPLGGPINKNFHGESILFVLEMNNDENKIMGIGMIKNKSHIKKFRIYSNDIYNRYGYIGRHRIDRNEICEEDSYIMDVLDQLCFYGSGHLKKIPGITGFPIDKLFRLYKKKNLDLVEFITNLFKKKINET